MTLLLMLLGWCAIPILVGLLLLAGEWIGRLFQWLLCEKNTCGWPKCGEHCPYSNFDQSFERWK